MKFTPEVFKQLLSELKQDGDYVFSQTQLLHKCLSYDEYSQPCMSEERIGRNIVDIINRAVPRRKKAKKTLKKLKEMFDHNLPHIGIGSHPIERKKFKEVKGKYKQILEWFDHCKGEAEKMKGVSILHEVIAKPLHEEKTKEIRAQWSLIDDGQIDRNMVPSGNWGAVRNARSNAEKEAEVERAQMERRAEVTRDSQNETEEIGSSSEVYFAKTNTATTLKSQAKRSAPNARNLRDGDVKVQIEEGPEEVGEKKRTYREKTNNNQEPLTKLTGKKPLFEAAADPESIIPDFPHVIKIEEENNVETSKNNMVWSWKSGFKKPLIGLGVTVMFLMVVSLSMISY